ncbi:hypothetical protein AWB80_05837 [Caballeronia pedi]|uniref:Lipoprotein n=1 Tax=Caballeronia pedi TaxID=1777141 RepID=A0A158CU07_9BURK|nr:hypothetical protein [Caballeronia pedi]SAK85808.1 hypothetical protein AWB80_05837 [Caballeronia pedi]
MKKCVLLTAWLGCIVMSASAKQPTSVQAIDREIQFEDCHFKMKDPYNGDFRASRDSTPAVGGYIANINPKARHPFDTSIQFSCENPATSQVLRDLVAMRMTDKGWALDPSSEIIGPKEQRTTFHALHGRGWDGGGVTADDINGDETRRMRGYAFCIPHRQLALCGVVRYVAYLKWPKESVLPQVIKLLESIEFIDSSGPPN